MKGGVEMWEDTAKAVNNMGTELKKQDKKPTNPK